MKKKKLTKKENEELLGKMMANYKEHIDWDDSVEAVSINEPYEYKGEGEIIKDEPTQPLYNITHSLTASEDSKITIQLEHVDDSLDNVRSEYIDLIKQMRIAKHRNELVCNEIINKHNKFMKSLKNHH